jgi:D-sedoheptulose 7-phosphate isomerase
VGEHLVQLDEEISRHQQALISALADLSQIEESLALASSRIISTLRSGRKLLIAGNGGSAAEAQHFAGELVGRFLRDRAPYAALALTTDTASLTAIGNDYGFEEVFARQVAAYGRPGDLFLAISTSGESENLVKAVDRARVCGVQTLAMTGARPSRLSDRAELTLFAPATEVPIVQELHMVMVHLLAGVVERTLSRELVELEVLR